MSCTGVGYDWLEKYADRALECIIYIGNHKPKNHKCRVTRYNVKKGKICAFVTPKCANCERNPLAIAFKYPARLKTQT